MSKIIVAYTVAGLALFGALFASLALSGLTRPGQTFKEIAELEVAQAPPPPSPAVYVPPVLESDRVYRISHETPIYRSPSQEGESGAETEQRMLPEGAYFRVVQTLDTPPGPWFEIVIDDEGRESTMYLHGIDLRWKTLTPQYSPDEAATMQQDAMLETLRASMALRRSEPIVEEVLPPPEPQTFNEWWAEVAPRLGGRTTANLVASAAAAGTATMLILGSIALLAVLRREHAWSRPSTHSIHDLDPGEDDPYAYAHKALDEEPDAQDGEDQSHA